MSDAASTNGPNRHARDAGGRFAAGNKGGPGNPFAWRAARLRSALYKAVKPANLEAIVAKLVEAAKAGDERSAIFSVVGAGRSL